MTASLIPSNYAEWRHCIEKKCGLALTPDYIATRLAALRDDRDAHTREFRRIYGEAHLRATIAWFTRAQQEPAN
jgi:hypothetical protein